MKRRLFTFLFIVLAAILVGPKVMRGLLQFTEGHRVMAVALADVNNDGYLDALLANGGGSAVHPVYILMNDGSGGFADDVRALEQWPGDSATLGDLDADGYADILLGLAGGSIVRYLNDGSGEFPTWDYLTRPAPLGVMHVQPLLGDLNNNGGLDIFAAGCCGREAELVPGGSRPLLSYSQVWLYDDEGRRSQSYTVGEAGSNAAALADLNGDGSLDVFLANGRTLDAAENVTSATPNTVLFNDGQGRLTDSGQRLGQAESRAVALGDLNDDGFVDAVVGNRGADGVWLNDGHGFFVDSGQRLGTGLTEHVFLVEPLSAGAPDLLVLGKGSGRVWLNDGMGQFRPGWPLRYGRNTALAVGDVTGDGLLDIFVADVNTYRVWRGEGNGRFAAGPATGYR